MNLQNQYVLRSLELSLAWSQKVGAAYNKVPSTTYGTRLLKSGIREFSHFAPAGGGWLSGLNDLPIPPGFTKGTVIHSARMLWDGSIDGDGDEIAVEFDNRQADGNGNNFNFSEQINIAAGWVWQVDNETGHWTTVMPIKPLTPLVWHLVDCVNDMDMTPGVLTTSFRELVIDGSPYVAPAAFAGLKAMKDPAGHFWKRGGNLQVQQCRRTAGSASLYAQDIGMVYIPAAA